MDSYMSYLITVLFTLVLSTWKCLSNTSLLIICIRKKNKTFQRFAMNIVCLIINALFQGVFGVLVSVIVITAIVHGVDTYTCSVTVILWICSITNESWQTLFVFIQQCRAFSAQRNTLNPRQIVLVNLCILAGSLISVGIPLMRWTKGQQGYQLQTCSSGVYVNPLITRGYIACLAGIPGIISVVIFVALQIRVRLRLENKAPTVPQQLQIENATLDHETTRRTANASQTSVFESPESTACHSPRSRVCHNPESRLTHSPESRVCHSPESRVCHSHESRVCHSPESRVCHSPELRVCNSPESTDCRSPGSASDSNESNAKAEQNNVTPDPCACGKSDSTAHHELTSNMAVTNKHQRNNSWKTTERSYFVRGFRNARIFKLMKSKSTQSSVPHEKKATRRHFRTQAVALKTLAYFLLLNTSLTIQYFVIWILCYAYPSLPGIHTAHRFSFILLYFNSTFNVLVLVKRYPAIREAVHEEIRSMKRMISKSSKGSYDPTPV